MNKILNIAVLLIVSCVAVAHAKEPKFNLTWGPQILDEHKQEVGPFPENALELIKRELEEELIDNPYSTMIYINKDAALRYLYFRDDWQLNDDIFLQEAEEKSKVYRGWHISACLVTKNRFGRNGDWRLFKIVIYQGQVTKIEEQWPSEYDQALVNRACVSMPHYIGVIKTQIP